MPAPVEWPDQFRGQVKVQWSSCPTTAYAEWWNQLETQAAFPSPNSCGRGQTLKPCPMKPCTPLCPKGRQGDFQPSYYGSSFRHLRWVKQLRRIQALRRLLGSSDLSANTHIRIVEVWQAIRHAVGFGQGFGRWWGQTFPAHSFADGLPLLPPTREQAQQMVVLFGEVVKKLEYQLGASSKQQAKMARAKDLSLIFRDCARDTPDRVDTLISYVEATVEDVIHDDCSVVCTSKIDLNPEHPVVVNGIPRSVVQASHDQVWLHDVQDIKIGDSLSQEVVTLSDHDIMTRFEQLWEPRWNKLSHLDPGISLLISFVKNFPHCNGISQSGR